MSVDQAIDAYKRFGEQVFGKKPIAGNTGKLAFGAFSTAFYSISKLQQAIRDVVKEAGLDEQESFQQDDGRCRTWVSFQFAAYSVDD